MRVNSDARRIDNVLDAGRGSGVDSRLMLPPAALAHIQRADEQHPACAGKRGNQRILVVEVAIARPGAPLRSLRERGGFAADESQLRGLHPLQQQFADHLAKSAGGAGNDNAHQSASAGTQFPCTPERSRIGTLTRAIGPFSRNCASNT